MRNVNYVEMLTGIQQPDRLSTRFKSYAELIQALQTKIGTDPDLFIQAYYRGREAVEYRGREYEEDHVCELTLRLLIALLTMQQSGKKTTYSRLTQQMRVRTKNTDTEMVAIIKANIYFQSVKNYLIKNTYDCLRQVREWGELEDFLALDDTIGDIPTSTYLLLKERGEIMDVPTEAVDFNEEITPKVIENLYVKVLQSDDVYHGVSILADLVLELKRRDPDTELIIEDLLDVIGGDM